MEPATYDLTLYQGDDRKLTFRLREQNEDLTPGAYIDLTGSTPKAQIRATPEDPTVAAEFTATLLDQTTTPGGVQLVLTGAQTAALDPAITYSWDVQVENPATEVQTYLRGSVTVEAQVTR
jgi:hypothetical protein